MIIPVRKPEYFLKENKSSGLETRCWIHEACSSIRDGVNPCPSREANSGAG